MRCFARRMAALVAREHATQERRLNTLRRQLSRGEAEGAAPLTTEDVHFYRKHGYLVVRGVFSASDSEMTHKEIVHAYEEHDYEASSPYDRGTSTSWKWGDAPDGYAYPKPGNFPMGSRILDRAPHLVPLTCEHPYIIQSCKEMLGDSPVLSQYQIYCRTPGAKGTGRSSATTTGFGCHYDYKPWRPVGSFLNWMFAVIPLVDYTEEVGPLLVSPGSHLRSRILPSTDGRVSLVEAGCVPEASSIELIDPQLKRGDLLLMNGFTWHEAWPNNSNKARIGIYLKFHGRHSPPAVGPIIHPKTALKFSKHGIFSSNFRSDNKYSAIVPFDAACGKGSGVGPSQTIDSVAVVLESADGKRVLMMNVEPRGLVRLPETPARELEQYTTRQLNRLQYLDAGNVIGTMLKYLKREFNVCISYLSWVVDAYDNPDGNVCDNPIINDFYDKMCRVYGYRLSVQEEESLVMRPGYYSWLSIADILNASPVTDERQRGWVNMWVNQCNAQGEPVTRTIGFPYVKYSSLFAGTYNAAGNTPASTFVVGEHLSDEEAGQVRPPPEKPFSY